MIPIKLQKVLTFEAGKDKIGWSRGGLPRAAAPPHEIYSYTELLRKVAALAYYNKQYSLLFRWQSNDFMYNANGEGGIHSHLYPSILRTVPGIANSPVDMKFVLKRRFAILAEAEKKLKASAKIGETRRDQTLRWALLQHYEVCPTPLLDVTSSLQIALSFALADSRDDTLLFVLAVPQITGIVAVSLESETQVVRLSQICPPEALRPHFQEASLIGNYPVWEQEEFLGDFRKKFRSNLAGRLLAKFRLNKCNSWREKGFTPTSAYILRPNDEDPYFSIMGDVKSYIRPKLDELRQAIGLPLRDSKR
ncbi:MAG TPA: FRG domain-containing protein [Desulfuromonadaceae bacterium]|jgi:hypothetical protein